MAMRFHYRSVSSSDSEDDVEPWGSRVPYTVSLDAQRYNNHLQTDEPRYKYRVDFVDEARYEAPYGEDPAGPSLGPSLLKVIIVCPEEREDVWLTTRYEHVSRVQFVLYPQDNETIYYLRLWKFENGTEEQLNSAGLLSAALAGNPFVFDREAVRQSCSAWEAKLKWNLAPLETNGVTEILQADRLFLRMAPGAGAQSGRAVADSGEQVQASLTQRRAVADSGEPVGAAFTQTEETEDCVIVSISGAKRVTRREVDGVLQEFQQLPNTYINGDYLRTRHLENGYPVFVKIYGEFYSTNDRICLIMSRRDNHWSFRTSADRKLRVAAANGNQVRTFAHIRVPPAAGSKELDELASAYDLEVRVPVQWRPRGRDHCETCQDAKVSVQTVACQGVLAHLAETANTHVRRKLLLDKEVECGFCFESKPFREFLVPECGHAYCRDCYLRWLAAEPNRCCSSGCAAPLSRYNTPETHSDFYPLWLRDMPDAEAPAASSPDAPAARGNQYVVRTQGAFCFRAV